MGLQKKIYMLFAVAMENDEGAERCREVESADSNAKFVACRDW
jgi:hypothetical protein